MHPRHRLAGIERWALPWISLEDEWLIGAGPELLDAIVETWVELYPQWRRHHSQLLHRLERCLLEGVFPQAQGLDERSRRPLLLSNVDSTVRQLLSHAGGAFSINRLHQAMRSRFDPPLRPQRPQQPGPRP